MTSPDAPVAPEPTGHPRVDEVISTLASVADASAADQVAPLTEAHRVLSETLESLDEA